MLIIFPENQLPEFQIGMAAAIPALPLPAPVQITTT